MKLLQSYCRICCELLEGLPIVEEGELFRSSCVILLASMLKVEHEKIQCSSNLDTTLSVETRHCAFISLLGVAFSFCCYQYFEANSFSISMSAQLKTQGSGCLKKVNS